MTTATAARLARLARLPQELGQRILVLDGAMGTMLQEHGFGEADFRGRRFRDHPRDLRGANDLLCADPAGRRAGDPRRLPRRRRRHHQHQHLQRHPHRPGRLRAAPAVVARDERRAARLAREAADAAERARPRAGRASWPARSGRRTGPPRSRRTSTTPAPATSPWTSSWRPTSRRPRGSLDGGADLLLIETIFDTLNAKAAIFAVGSLCGRAGVPVPLIISGTITDAPAGRCRARPWRPSGTASATPPARRRPQLRPGRGQLREHLAGARPASRTVPSRPTRTPACPTASAATTRRPDRDGRGDRTSGREMASSTSWAAAAARRPRTSPPSPRPWPACAPRVVPVVAPRTRLAGLRAAGHRRPATLFVNVGERTNVTGSRAFARLVPTAARTRRWRSPASRSRAAPRSSTSTWTRRCSTREAAMTRFLRLIAAEPDISRGAGHDRLLEVVGHRGRAARAPGPAASSTRSRSRRARPSSCARPGWPALRGGGRGHGLRRAAARPTRVERRVAIARAPTACSPSRPASSPRTSSSTPTSSPSAPASRSTPATRSPTSRPSGASRRSCPASLTSAAASPTSRSRSAATTPCARPSTPSSCTTPSRPAWTWRIVNAGALPVFDDLDPDLRERVEDLVLDRRPDATERLLEIADRVRRRGSAWRGRPRPGLARGARRRAAHARPRGGHRRLDRGGHGGGAPARRAAARRHRGAAHGGHERRRRPVRQPGACSCPRSSRAPGS